MNIPSFAPNIGQPATFPACEAAGSRVDSRAFVEPKTGLAVGLAGVALAISALVCIIVFYLGIVVLIGIAVDYYRRRKALALIKGSAIEITEAQFPEIYSCTKGIAERLGLTEVPAIYLVEGNTINAAAVRLAGRRVIILVDDLVHACLVSGEPRTLAFCIAHELAHHALGHTGYFRSQASRMMKWLSRLDEYSCDAVANQVVGNPAISRTALTILASGPQMLRYVNIPQLIEQARQVEADKISKKAERQLSHPLLLRRLYRFIN